MQRLECGGIAHHLQAAIHGKQQFGNRGYDYCRNNNNRWQAGRTHAQDAVRGFQFAWQGPGRSSNGVGTRDAGIDAADPGVSQRIHGLARDRQRGERDGEQESQQCCSRDQTALRVESHGRRCYAPQPTVVKPGLRDGSTARLQHVARQVLALREILQPRIDIGGVDDHGFSAAAGIE